MKSLPGDYVEQAEHACPASCAGLAEVGEVLEVVGGDIAVDGELATRCQWRSTNTQGSTQLTLRTSRYTCNSGKRSATRR